jgi:hypothetical protein
MKCKICSSTADLFDKAAILNKYEATYYRCSECGFVWVDNPFWLDEAYAGDSFKYDLGILQRNISISYKLQAIIKLCFPEVECLLDYGGGMGILTRIMRDNGFDMHWYDKYASNLFARGFDKVPSKIYDVVTAFEIFEHIPKPEEEIGKILKIGTNIIFSTDLLPEPTPRICEWWYYMPVEGQHISFYTKKSLECLSKRLGLNYTGYENLHIFSTKQVDESLMRRCCTDTYKINSENPRKSLLPSDFEKVTGIPLKRI